MGFSARTVRICFIVVLAALLIGAAWEVVSSYWHPSYWQRSYWQPSYGQKRDSQPAASTRREASEVRPPAAPIYLRVVGHGFYWRFSFAGADQRFGTADDLDVQRLIHLPVNSEVNLSVESEDYVYMFSAPKLGVRQIAVPELSYDVSFQADQVGRFALITDPFCGVRVFHDGDMGSILVQSQTEFENWYMASHSRKTSS